VLTVSRHGVELRFDDSGFTEPPYVYRPLLSDALYEEIFLEHIRRAGREGVYLDIGAHLGTHTVWFAALCPSSRVYAFEPVGRFARVARRSIVANDLRHKVSLRRIGLSDRPGEATTALSPEHQMGYQAEPAVAEETFPVRRLDDLRIPRPVAVMKLDIEGMEAAALRGAGRILARDHPLVYAEVHNEERADEIAAVLAPYGYAPTGWRFNSTPTLEFALPS
jgi:FkbM family methyltransferase